MGNSELALMNETWRRYGYKPPTNWRPTGYPKYAPEEECFAWAKRIGCGALKSDFCRYGKCNFYKHRSQYEREVKKNAVDYLG